MPIHAPFWGVLGYIWGKGNFVFPYRNAISRDLRPMNQIASKSLLQFSLGTQAKIGGHKKRKLKQVRVIFHPFAGTPPLERSLCILACEMTSPT